MPHETPVILDKKTSEITINEDYTKQDAMSYVLRESSKIGIDPKVVEKVIFCESSWDSTAIGDSGKSFGLWQLYKPEEHHHITKECALDVICSTSYALPLFKKQPTKWTCFRKMF